MCSQCEVNDFKTQMKKAMTAVSLVSFQVQCFVLPSLSIERLRKLIKTQHLLPEKLSTLHAFYLLFVRKPVAAAMLHHLQLRHGPVHNTEKEKREFSEA